MNDKKNGFAPWFATTFLIGFGFFTMGLMDPLYDTYLPIFLRNYIKSMTLVGFIMTFDNILSLFLIPVVSVLSDNTRTKIGRRMPWIVTLLPLSAVLFAGIPFAAQAGLIALIAVVFLLNVFKSSVRGPVVALMPDIIPADYRSEANGIINTMSGIAAILSTLFLARLMDVDAVLPILGNVKNKLPFMISAALVVVAVIVLFVKIKEKHADEKTSERIPILKSIKAIALEKDKSAGFILISIVLWFLGHQGIVPYIGLFSTDVLKLSKGSASLAAGIVAIAYAVAAIPSGYLAHNIGRKKIIRFCLVGLTVIACLLFFYAPISANLGLKGTGALVFFYGLMFIYGIFWGALNTNSFPMLWQMASYGNMGIYTGIYYTASQTAAILSPLITGFLMDLFKNQGVRALEKLQELSGIYFDLNNNPVLIPLNWESYAATFAFCAVCMALAFFTMGFVTKGEAVKEKEAISK